MNHRPRSASLSYDEALLGKVALVTGASRGIGRAIAVRLAARGADVALNARAGAPEAVAEVRALGRRAFEAPCDMGDEEAVESMVDGVLATLGGVDILVNNAGIFRFADFVDLTAEDFWEVVRVDLAGPFFCSQAVARDMIRRGSGGRIVMISSVSAHVAQPTKSHYAAAKAGLEMLAKTMAVELAVHGITVNCIAPGGPILTDANREEIDRPEYEAIVKRRVPMGRTGRPEEVAAAVDYLVSNEASYVTGAVLVIDGGLTLRSP